MSGVGSGVDTQFGIVNEAFYGTPVTVTRFLSILNEGIVADQGVIEAFTLGRGLHMRTGRTKRFTRAAAGPVPFVVTRSAFGKILEQLGAATNTWVGGTLGSGVLTCDTNPTADDTVTIGSTVYTFKSSITTTAFQVLRGSTLAESLRNLAHAINLGPGEGVYYGSLTTIHPTVSAAYTATTVTVTDKNARGDGATDATTETFTASGNVWGAVTLEGGVDGSNTEYKQTFTPDSRGNRNKSATVQVGRPATNGLIYPFTYSGSKVTGWTLSLALDGWLTLTVNWDCKGESQAVALATPSYATDGTIYDFSQAALTAEGTAVNLTSFEFSAALALATGRRYLGNTKLNPLANGEWVYTGTVGCYFDNNDHQTAWLAQTHAKLILTLTGETIAGSSNPYKFVFTLEEVEWTGQGPNAAGPDLLVQPRPFKALDDGTNPAWQIDYHTADTTF